MSLLKEASLAYIFDAIRNTFVDDEDKSLGNKFALIDMDNVNTPDLDQTPDSILTADPTLAAGPVALERLAIVSVAV